MVAITFDDGYADNVKLAVPVMDALGLRATFFVVAGLIGTDGELWYDRILHGIDFVIEHRAG